MQRIDDHKNENLWDPWHFLGPKRKKLLERSWAGVFRRFLFEELPVKEIASRFDERMGRPTKELYTMVGLLVLEQMLDLSDEEVTVRLAFDEQFAYALDIPGDRDEDRYVCERTLWEYRGIAMKRGLDKWLFENLTDTLLKAFGVDTSKQRLDSTHVCSNMRELRRGEIFARVIAGFLRNLRRQQGAWYEQVEKGGVDRYLKGEACACFSSVKPSEIKRTVAGMSEDLLWLVERFRGNQAVERMNTYKMLVRVLEEQCEVIEEEGEEPRVQLKKASEVPADSLQNPSDPDATYDKHKGQGYQIQIMETYQEENSEEEKKGYRPPDLITYVDVEPAHKSDTDALVPAIESTEARGCKPEELLADGGYGSDANVERALEANVEVIAPANKGSSDEETLRLDDFELDGETGEVIRCPAGEKPTKTGRTPKGHFTANFDRAKCLVCPLRGRCPVRVSSRTARLKQYTAKKMRLARRRAEEKRQVFRDKYRWRAGVEATMSRYKSQTGAERLRVRGLAAVRFAARMKALGLNILRCARVAAETSKTIYSTYFGQKSPRVTFNTCLLGCLLHFFVREAIQTRNQPLHRPLAA